VLIEKSVTILDYEPYHFFAGRKTPSKCAGRAERGIADDATVVKRQLQKLIDLITPKRNTCDIEHILKACHHMAV